MAVTSECERHGALSAKLDAHIATQVVSEQRSKDVIDRLFQKMEVTALLVSKIPEVQESLDKLTAVIDSMEKQQARVEGAAGLAKAIGGVVLALFGVSIATWITSLIAGKP